MATPAELEEKGELSKLVGILDDDQPEERLVYALPRARDWLTETLPLLETDGFHENAASPQEQAYDLFYAFLSGEDDFAEFIPKPLRPKDSYVWELRTADLRFFGWFWRKGIFILSAVDLKQRCARYNLYAGYRDQCEHDRETLDLDPPKFIAGDLNDVV